MVTQQPKLDRYVQSGEELSLIALEAEIANAGWRVARLAITKEKREILSHGYYTHVYDDANRYHIELVWGRWPNTKHVHGYAFTISMALYNAWEQVREKTA